MQCLAWSFILCGCQAPFRIKNNWPDSSVKDKMSYLILFQTPKHNIVPPHVSNLLSALYVQRYSFLLSANSMEHTAILSDAMSFLSKMLYKRLQILWDKSGPIFPRIDSFTHSKIHSDHCTRVRSSCGMNHIWYQSCFPELTLISYWPRSDESRQGSAVPT